jgi:hypothetical protein
MMTFKHATAIVTGTAIQQYRALYVGGTGDVVVRMLSDQNTITFKAVPVGTTLWIEVDQVLSGSTATNMVGLN